MAADPRRWMTVAAALLAAGAVTTAVLVRQDTRPAPSTQGRDSPLAGEDGERFLGCVRDIGADAFALAVSRVRPDDPLRIETYGLIGSGGLTLSEHAEHTIEVVGRLEPSGDAFPNLRVLSARHVATFCWKP